MRVRTSESEQASPNEQVQTDEEFSFSDGNKHGLRPAVRKEDDSFTDKYTASTEVGARFRPNKGYEAECILDHKATEIA